MKPGLLAALLGLFSENGLDLGALGLAWARVFPAATILPVFSLRGLPAQLRAMFALLIAFVIVPAVAMPGIHSGPWELALAEEFVRGLPVAVAAAVPLYVLTMVGGLVDGIRGVQESLTLPFGDGRGGSGANFFSLLAGVLFFATGGPARLAHLLLAAPAVPDLLGLVKVLFAGILLAISLGAPLLAAAFVVDVATLLIAKTAQPAPVQAFIAPMKAAGLALLLAVTLPYLLDAATASFLSPTP